MSVSAARLERQARRLRTAQEAVSLAAELGCEVAPHPELPGVVEARSPLPGIWLLAGTADEVRAEVRACGMREWLGMLGTLAQRAA